MSPEKSYVVMVWANMMTRCYLETHKQYKDYGGRGIKVCVRWHDFDLFCEDMLPRPSRSSLNRIDNSGDYGPENCEWADSMTQNNNRRSNIHVTIEGTTKTMAQWSRVSGVDPETISYRLKAGWDPKSAVFSREFSRRKNEVTLTYQGKTGSCRDWESWTGISYSAIYERIQHGWPVDRILTTPVRKKNHHLS